MMAAAKRTTKEPEVRPDSPFAPIVEAARAQIRTIVGTLPPEDAEPAFNERDLMQARIEGMTTILLMCQRAGAGDVVVEKGQRLVKLERAPHATDLEARVARLEAIAFGPRKRGVLSLIEPTNERQAERITSSPAARNTPSPASADVAMTKGQRVVLTAIAQSREGATREMLTVLTGYKKTSRDTYLGQLRALGFVAEARGRFVATATGVRKLGPHFNPLPTGSALLNHWLGALPQGERRVLEIVAGAYPSSVTREQLTTSTQYKKTSRDTYIARLAARELVDAGRDGVRASAVLFDR